MGAKAGGRARPLRGVPGLAPFCRSAAALVGHPKVVPGSLRRGACGWHWRRRSGRSGGGAHCRPSIATRRNAPISPSVSRALLDGKAVVRSPPPSFPLRSGCGGEYIELVALGPAACLRSCGNMWPLCIESGTDVHAAGRRGAGAGALIGAPPALLVGLVLKPGIGEPMELRQMA